MTKLIINGTEDTPSVNMDAESKEISFAGRSLPEDVISFYEPVMQWISEFGSQPTDAIDLMFKLEYFNTASSKIILDILMKFEEISQSGSSKVNIKWYYDERDADMLEAGEEYKELVEVPFELVKFN